MDRAEIHESESKNAWWCVGTSFEEDRFSRARGIKGAKTTRLFSEEKENASEVSRFAPHFTPLTYREDTLREKFSRLCASVA